MQPNGCIYSAALDAVFKALADAEPPASCWMSCTRTTVRRCRNCARIWTMSRQAVTKHLVLLEEANLVATVWRGREKLHFLNPVPLHEISERWIAKYERDRLQALSDLKKGLEQTEQTQIDTSWKRAHSFTSPTSAPRRRNSGQNSPRPKSRGSFSGPRRCTPTGKWAAHGTAPRPMARWWMAGKCWRSIRPSGWCCGGATRCSPRRRPRAIPA